MVFSDHRFMRLIDLILGKGNVHAQNLGTVEQPLCVLLQAKNGRSLVGLVGPHTLKGTTPIMKRVREHMDLGVTPFDQTPIHPNFSVAIIHRLGYSTHLCPLNCKGSMATLGRAIL
jgi:hypothetical protein